MKSENNKKLNDFFNQEYKALKSYVSSKIRASVDYDPEDILQDVALKLFTGADRYSAINNVAGFVYYALKNKIIDVMRTSKKQHISHEQQNEAKLIEFAALLSDSPDNTYSEQMTNALKTAIINLKPNYKNIIIAIDFESYTYKEISEETGIPVGTLMSRRHRAISLLYKTLKADQDIIN